MTINDTGVGIDVHLHEPHDVVAAYHRAIDAGRATDGLDLFTDDAVFQVRDTELVGREAIARFLTDREAQTDRHTVHVIANPVQARVGQDRVEISALVLLHVRQPGGHYVTERVLDTTHEVTRQPAGWKIRRRLSRPLHPPVTR